jgi:hypothetical protein
MGRPRVARITLLTALVLLLLPAGEAVAGERQLHGGPTLGFGASWGAAGAYDGSVGAFGGYGLSDAFLLYGNVEYALGGLNTGPGGVRHRGSLSVGVAYTLDVISVLPWFGLGLQGSLVSGSGGVEAIPAVEARGGADWLIRRYFGLTAQVAYALSWWNRGTVSDAVTATVGVRFTVDL